MRPETVVFLPPFFNTVSRAENVHGSVSIQCLSFGTIAAFTIYNENGTAPARLSYPHIPSFPSAVTEFLPFSKYFVWTLPDPDNTTTSEIVQPVEETDKAALFAQVLEQNGFGVSSHR